MSPPELGDVAISLFDIDPERLKTSEIVAQRLSDATGLSKVTVKATLDRRQALANSDFGLRTITVLTQICRDMEEVCPDALLMQYVNPMAINCWAIKEIAPQLRNVGLCHSVQHPSEHLAERLGENIADIDYISAGINHVSFFLNFVKRHAGQCREDLYPRLKALAAQGCVPDDDLVRFDVLKCLGYFVTESSEHFSEYISWYIKGGRNDLIERLNIPLDEYLRRCDRQIAEWQELRQDLEGNKPIEVRRLIDNLPAECVVEVPCHVDDNGIQPIHIGKLPPQLAGVIRQSVSVRELTVHAAMTHKRDYVYQAALLDPHTSVELSPDQIWRLVDDLIEAHGSSLPSVQLNRKYPQKKS